MIEIRDLHFSYTRNQQLFENLSLQLGEGRIYGLLGKNGTGKTTLLKLMLGVLFPQAGQIRVVGFDPQMRSPDMLSQLYYLPEEFEMPAVSVSIFEKIHGSFYPGYDQDKFYHLIQQFEVPEKAHLQKLSFGQKKKVLIAFGIATASRILLFDEPTNGLDIPSKSQFRKILASNLGKTQTIVISTHQVRDLTNLIDSIIIIENGEIIFDKDLHMISQKLLFESALKAINPEKVLYSEMVPGGYVHVSQNHEGQDSEVDLEVLFNAILSDSDRINQLF